MGSKCVSCNTSEAVFYVRGCHFGRKLFGLPGAALPGLMASSMTRDEQSLGMEFAWHSLLKLIMVGFPVKIQGRACHKAAAPDINH